VHSYIDSIRTRGKDPAIEGAIDQSKSPTHRHFRQLYTNVILRIYPYVILPPLLLRCIARDYLAV
jgi:hypothetical protein